MINRDVLYFSIMFYFYPSLFLLGICFFSVAFWEFYVCNEHTQSINTVFIVLTLPFCLSNGDIFVT